MGVSTPLVVFTDLDGTLLDHVTYTWEPAIPALHRLAQLGAPVVLSSSKTAAEITELQDRIGLTHYPAIVENGSGLIGLAGMTDAARGADEYAAIRQALAAVPRPLRAQFRGFGDMTLSELMDLTGLPQDDAKRAQTRAFSEPGLWAGSDTARAEFVAALRTIGITARQGGRFLTLSFGKTKADRMAEVIAHYSPAHTLALGDAPNDTEMLERADFGVIIANPHHTPLPTLQGEAADRIIRTDHPGPIGWNRAVLDLLERLGLNDSMTQGQTKGTHCHG